MKIVLAQLNFTVGDLSGNTDKIIAYTKKARDELKADLIVFPELALSGYPPEDLLLRNDFNTEVQKGLVKIQKAITGIDVIFGYPEADGDSLCYNSAAILHDGKIIAVYSKQLLPNYGVFDEERYFKRGEKPCVINLKNKRIGILICEDIWRPEPMRNTVSEGAELVVIINASPFHKNKSQIRENILKLRCRENNTPILYVNMIGGQDELIFDGGSLFMDASGEILDRADFFKEQLLFVEASENIPLEIKKSSSALLPTLSTEALMYKALVLGLRDYVNKNKFKSLILGLSGGIDSALALAIAVDAIGKEKVEAVMMPSAYTAQISIDDAKEMANIHGITYEVISIEPLFSTALETLNPLFLNLKKDVTEENIQARCRGLLLMALSNKKNALVLSASNKSEMAVGYATLYGDMVGGFAVLKDLYKTMVYRLAHYRNTLSTVIPERVIIRPPSAELSPNQKDSDTLPPYSILDDILERYIENNESAENIIAAGFDASVVRKVVALIIRSEYKRRQAPPGPKVTSLSFGRDRRYPITSKLL